MRLTRVTRATGLGPHHAPAGAVDHDRRRALGALQGPGLHVGRPGSPCASHPPDSSRGPAGAGARGRGAVQGSSDRGHSLSLCARGGPWGVPSWALHSDTPTFTLQEPCTALGARIRPCSPSCWPWVWGALGGTSVGLGTAATRDHCLGKTTEPGVGSELPRAPPAPTPHGACCPWIRRGGRVPPLCCPSFLFGKNFNLEENLQGGPREHHLLFTLKFQKHAKYRKTANICILPPPQPLPRKLHRPIRVGVAAASGRPASPSARWGH